MVGKSAQVETVHINKSAGDYVEGVWKLTSTGQVWENDRFAKRLRWQQGDQAFELFFIGVELNREDLVRIAESLTPCGFFECD